MARAFFISCKKTINLRPSCLWLNLFTNSAIGFSQQERATWECRCAIHNWYTLFCTPFQKAADFSRGLAEILLVCKILWIGVQFLTPAFQIGDSFFIKTCSFFLEIFFINSCISHLPLSSLILYSDIQFVWQYFSELMVLFAVRNSISKILSLSHHM